MEEKKYIANRSSIKHTISSQYTHKECNMLKLKLFSQKIICVDNSENVRNL